MNDTSENDTDSQSEPDGPETTDEVTPAALDDPLVGSASDDVTLPLERVFDILRNERRQRVLGYLAITDDEVIRIGDLAEHVAAIENDMPVNALSSQQRKRVYVALYQCHLPKMADAGVIEFDKDRGTIKIGPNAAQLRPYLDVEPESNDDATRVEMPFAVLSIAGVVAYLFAAFAGGSGIAIGGFVLVGGVLAAALIGYRDHVA